MSYIFVGKRRFELNLKINELGDIIKGKVANWRVGKNIRRTINWDDVTIHACVMSQCTDPCIVASHKHVLWRHLNWSSFQCFYGRHTTRLWWSGVRFGIFIVIAVRADDSVYNGTWYINNGFWSPVGWFAHKFRSFMTMPVMKPIGRPTCSQSIVIRGNPYNTSSIIYAITYAIQKQIRDEKIVKLLRKNLPFKLIRSLEVSPEML